MRPRRLRFLAPFALALAAGCEEPRHVAGPRPAPAPAPAPEPTKEDDAFIVGKRTQDVKDAGPALKAGAQVGSTRIVARDPITLPGNAYVTIIGKNSILNIKHAVDLYQAENGRYPADYNEFMDEIIKKNGIALPQLSYYQEYGYDAPNHALTILEYPDRKAQGHR